MLQTKTHVRFHCRWPRGPATTYRPPQSSEEGFSGVKSQRENGFRENVQEESNVGQSWAFWVEKKFREVLAGFNPPSKVSVNPTETSYV